MAKNIVYLLGAGASANSLPTIRFMSLRMRYFLRLIENAQKKIGSPRNDYDLSRLTTLNRLLDDVDVSGTPDTVAKMYHFKGADDDLQLLRIFLCCYMLFEQLDAEEMEAQRIFTDDEYLNSWQELLDNSKTEIDSLHKNQLDSRYIEFLAALMLKSNGRTKVRDNVKILSWNYDHQVEKGLGFISGLTLDRLQDIFGIFPKTEKDDSQIEDAILENEAMKACILKLNGTAGFVPNSNYPLFDVNKTKLEKGTWIKFLNVLLGSFHTGVSHTRLVFAWENDYKSVVEVRKVSEHQIRQADSVVVIGYSFPNFNREVDRQIFEEFDIDKGTIYIQDPYPDEIIEKLDGVKKGLKDRAVAVRSGGSFTIPNEFWE